MATAVDNARLYHSVKDANRQKDEFLAMLAHELRNPLAAIRYAVALGQLSPAESREELYEIIDRQTLNLARLIDDLLDVSRISRDKVSLRKEPIDAAVVVNRAAAAVRPLIDEKKHQLTVDVSDQPMPLLADPTRAEQIIANLLTNAAKYTPDQGHISVRAARTVGRPSSKWPTRALVCRPRCSPTCLICLHKRTVRLIVRRAGWASV